MKSCLIASVLVMALAATSASADIGIIYNVTFEDPPHTLNSAVSTGAGMADRPNSTIGAVITRSGLADFTTQVASLEPAGSMNFLSSTPIASGLILLSWDMAILSFGPGGNPNTAMVTIEPSGCPAIVMIWQRDFDFQIDYTNVAVFSSGRKDHYEFLIDLDNDRYDFSFNGTPVHTDQSLHSSFDIHFVSFGAEYLQSPSYAVDNFRMEIIPEPSTFLLISTGGLAACGWRFLKARAAGQ